MQRLLSILVILILSSCASTNENPDNNFDDFYSSPDLDQIESESIELNTEQESETNNNLTQEKDMEFNQKANPKKGEEIVLMKTSMGDIKVRLFPKRAPKTVENFKGLIKKSYYDGIIFHRVIENFMIQGGDPTGSGMGGESVWGGKFDDEFSADLKNIRGALSMANAGANTNGSQFFIVQAPQTPWLDNKHAVFGQVFEGMDIVDAIAKVEVDHMDRPVSDVVMEEVTITKYE